MKRKKPKAKASPVIDRKPKGQKQDGVIFVSKAGVALAPEVIADANDDAYKVMHQNILRRNFERGRFPDQDYSGNDTGPTAQRLAHEGIGAADSFRTDSGREITRISAVDWLLTNGRISGEAYSAAYKLLDDWYFSGLAQKVTADMSRDIVDCGGGSDPFDLRRMIAARRYVEATTYIGPKHSHPLHMMLEQEMSPVRYGMDLLRWKDRAEASAAAKQKLADALEILAEFYAPPQKNERKRSHYFIMPEALPKIM